MGIATYLAVSCYHVKGKTASYIQHSHDGTFKFQLLSLMFSFYCYAITNLIDCNRRVTYVTLWPSTIPIGSLMSYSTIWLFYSFLEFESFPLAMEHLELLSFTSSLLPSIIVCEGIATIEKGLLLLHSIQTVEYLSSAGNITFYHARNTWFCLQLCGWICGQMMKQMHGKIRRILSEEDDLKKS